MKRMMHPDHGFHHAANVHEEAAMRTRGWVEDDGSALAAKLKVAAPQEQEKGAPPGGPAPAGAASRKAIKKPVKTEDDVDGMI